MIHAQNISKVYDLKDHKVTALQDVSFELNAASTLAIQGPSGAGKSTLLGIIGGLDAPSSGIIKILGQNVHDSSEKEEALFRNSFLGYLFQFHHLLSDLTIIENVSLPLWIGKVDPQESKQRTLELLDSLGIADLAGRYPAELSGGEQQRAALARAVIHKPKLILADEPTGSLDEKNAQVVFEMLLNLQKELEATLVIVTHRKDYMTQMQHQLVLEKGRVKSFD